MPSDLGVRVGVTFSAGPLSGAFSGLLAAAITQMDGLGGYEGWRWIFIIEGMYFFGDMLHDSLNLFDQIALDLAYWEHLKLTMGP